MKITSVEFEVSAPDLRACPAWALPEFALIGRSNGGKSSLINLLAARRDLAKVSDVPGKTKLINFFVMNGAWSLVDLPGYGYAEVSGSAKHHWQDLLGRYVQAREQLVALVLIMDARRPFTELDVEMLEWFAPTGKPIHCLLSKADKLNRSEQSDAMRLAKTILSSYVDEAGQPLPFSVQLFSALKRIGLEEADQTIRGLLGLDGNDIDEPEVATQE